MASRNSLEALVEREVARGEAAKQLQEIAQRVPDFLEEFAREFLRLRGQDMKHAPNAEQEQMGRHKMSPTEAIMAWFATHREGTAAEVVKELSDKIRSGAAKPRVTIYSTLASLKKREKLQRKQNVNGESVYSLP